MGCFKRIDEFESSPLTSHLFMILKEQKLSVLFSVIRFSRNYFLLLVIIPIIIPFTYFKYNIQLSALPLSITHHSNRSCKPINALLLPNNLHELRYKCQVYRPDTQGSLGMLRGCLETRPFC